MTTTRRPTSSGGTFTRPELPPIRTVLLKVAYPVTLTSVGVAMYAIPYSTMYLYPYRAYYVVYKVHEVSMKKQSSSTGEGAETRMSWLGSRGEVGRGEVRRGTVRQSWYGEERRARAICGSQGVSGLGWARVGAVRHGGRGSVRKVEPGQDVADKETHNLRSD
jgi:hypothetical protein